MAPTRINSISETGRERAVSEVIGAIMLVSVVVLTVAIIGVALTSQGTPQKIPALDAIISNYGNTIQIYHNGGDTLQSDQMQILVDGIPTIFTKGENNLPWTSWSAGDSLVAKMDSTPTTVRIIFNGASGASTVLTSADFSPGGMINSGPIATDTLKAAFTGTPSSGAPPLVVQFTDQSTGYPVGWEWNFGDGMSTAKSPTHVYNSAGTYSVSLRVTNYTGSTDSTIHTITVSSYSPTVSGSSPNQGVQGSSVPISVYGTNFVSGAGIILKNQSTTITATSVTFVSATTLTGTVAIPSGATPGPWDIVVTNPDMQTGTLTNGFTINHPGPGPAFTSIEPPYGPTSGGTSVTIFGGNFVSGGTFGVTIGGVAATITGNTATSITAVSPPGTAGARDVMITNSNGQTATGAGAYTYAVPPTFTSIAPLAGTTLGGTAITITGTNLIGATTVTIGGTPATGVTVVSGSSLLATTPAHAAGAVDVVVTTPNGTATGPGAYTYGAAPPTFTSITPAAGPIAGGTSVTITGSGFTGATAVTVGGTAATGVTVVSDTSITAITPFHAAGVVNIVVTTPGGTATGTSIFTYTITAAPTFTSIAPAAGPIAGGTTVIITGTNFVAGGSLGVKIGGVAAMGVVRNSATQITAVTPAGTVGAKDIVITNSDGQTVTRTSAYTYAAPPTFTSIAPAAGPITLGTPVTITGTGFIGATAVTFGGTAATAVTVVSDTLITATVPAHAFGVVNVVVTTPGGTATGTGVYTYTAAPTTTLIAPAYGRIDGGTSVTITGTNFIAGATAVTFGGTEATSFTVVSATSITATTPAHAAGAGNVIVTTPGGASVARAYTYADPTITSMGGTITGARGTTATTIQINGANYFTSPVPMVTFTLGANTMTATVTAVTATRVTVSVVIPAGQPTGAYSVTVTNNDGGTATRISAFTVT